MRTVRVSRTLAVLLATLSALWLGCGGGADLAGPALGALEITTTTTGPEPDADGYAVSIDGGAAEPVGTDTTLRKEELAAGDHTVELSGLAANCAVAGGSSLAVTVAANAVAAASFAVTCAPTTGAITVTATTAGAPEDPDGYELLLDGAAAQPIGAGTTVTIAGVAPGSHAIELGGVAANCRVDGDNPRAVAVIAGDTSTVPMAVTCAPPSPTTGTLGITTLTSGPDPDPDGYSFAIDGGAAQPVGLNATVEVADLAEGAHTVTLAGASANCTIGGGENPRSVSIPAGASVGVTFGVTCTALTGGLQVTAETTGSPADPDGYTVSVDGGPARDLGLSGTLTFDGLEPRDHSVQLGGLAANCTAQGDNPRTVTVTAGATAGTTFTVTCTATTGSLTVTIAGLPSGTDAAVTVTGPGSFSRPVTATQTLTDLEPGSYTVAAAEVTSGGTRYTVTPASRAVTVTAADTASATVTYALVPPPSLNFRIDGWHFTQSTQTSIGDVPLVSNRDGYLRVFVVASGANSAAPVVRVRLYRNGALTQTFTIPAPESATPTARDEARLGSSWNLKIPRSFIRPGLGVLADVDPDNAIAETDESDNAFPAAGVPLAEDVRGAPVLTVRFVPVRQRVSGLQGNVSSANKAQFLELSRRMWPLPATDGDVHAVYTTGTSDPLQATDGNGAWGTVLGELNALRVVEGTGRTYYGVVRLDYFSGIGGLGYLGLPTAMGYDNEFGGGIIMAHELGHTWNRQHAPCGGAGDPDALYPYPGGAIGVYGLDMHDEVLKLPTQPDIMGYCGDAWVSDYNYRAVLAFRGSAPAAALVAVPARAQRCLLVWGRIVDGRPVLEPAFEVVTRPSLPAAPGPYSLQAAMTDGRQVFDLSFDAAEVADDPRKGRHFAFAVPLGADAGELGTLRLTAPGGTAEAARATPPAAAARAPDIVEARRVAGGVRLQWDGTAHPMVMVRDARTGEVLSFARGGEAELATDAAELDVASSDRVGSRTVRTVVAP